MSLKIAALVVTYNRKELLRRCLDALFSQTRPPEAVYVIDNASTDGTEAFLNENGYMSRPDLVYRRLPENMGGSGGFHAGMETAIADDCQWVWLMDDDAEPEPGALFALEQAGLRTDRCYGSCAVFEDESNGLWLCWPAVEKKSHTAERRRIRRYDELPAVMKVIGIPFLGFMVNREIIKKAGLPDPDYFVSGDDMDYGERVKKVGASLMLIKSSRIRHPRPSDYTVRFLGREFFCLRMPPWRRYYDIRNRVVNGRRHYGFRLLFMTLPGVFVRWGATLIYESGRARQCYAYGRGIFDGLFNRLGKRWDPSH